VTGLRIERGRVAGVVTPRGEIRSETVVYAAGAWARAVGELGGVSIAIAPMRHQLRITSPIAGVVATDPITRLIDAAVYLRPARGGLMYGVFERGPLPLDPRHIAATFTMAATPLDGAVLDGCAGQIADQVEAIAGAATAEQRGGLFTMTADGRFLIGPVPELAGFWVATGCNGSGFSLSSGIGRVLAEWIHGGEPSLDLRSFAPGRFAAEPLTDEALAASGIWQYENYYTPRGIVA
jgi:4-methylaminobutanoate oxidase (formaldehyde-forming)